MKIFISADIEGIGGVVRGEQSSRDAADYAHARKLMTAEVNSAIQGAFDGGATEVVVTDAHSIGLNLISDEVDERAKLILGTPRRLGMMEGVDLGCDAAFFLGYHASAGTAKAVIAHSYRRRVAEIKLNGRKVGEFGFNAAVASHFNVPVILVSGDEALCAEARALLPQILAVPVKEGLGAYSALCLHPKQTQALIHQSAKQALLSSTERGIMPPIGQPTVIEVRFTTASAIDRCLRLPGTELRDGTTLRYEARDVLDAYQVFNVMADLAELVPHI
jgi:D-amino peptidase